MVRRYAWVILVGLAAGSFGLAAQTAAVPGTATLTGTVESSTPYNAAQVFINWLASKEGLELYARAVKWSPTRNDIDESFVPAVSIPRSGVRYFDLSDWEFTVTTKEKARLRLSA